MAIIMNGKEVRDNLYESLKKDVDNLDFTPSLTVIVVGDDEASKVYVNNKIKSCEQLGITSKVMKCDKNISKEELTNIINTLNNDDSCTGILVQSPLPSHLDEVEIFNLIDKDKDVDGFNNYNAGALVKSNEGIIPCTVKGIGYLLDYYNIDVAGKDVTIIGRSNIVGKPLANFLTNRDATVTLCHSKTNDLRGKTLTADILVVAVGHANLIDETFVKDGAVVIDVGINRVDGKLIGDVNFESVKDKCSYITPVPGGVGPMTVAMLMDNVIKRARKK